jgi:lysozyme
MSRARIVRGAVAIGAAGALLIKGFEGEVLCTYADPGTRAAPWTIGFGHTGPDVKPGQCITRSRAEELLRDDIRTAQAALSKCVRVPVSEPELGALTSIALNNGGAPICASTMVRKLNAGDYAGAAAEFLRWNRANGKVMPGLVKRRQCEQGLFLADPNQPAEAAARAIKVCIQTGLRG